MVVILSLLYDVMRRHFLGVLDIKRFYPKRDGQLVYETKTSREMIGYLTFRLGLSVWPAFVMVRSHLASCLR